MNCNFMLTGAEVEYNLKALYWKKQQPHKLTNDDKGSSITNVSLEKG